jgi:mRNA-degrading endonuclease RelE of RelBE toxin-antitoxin system
MTVKRRLSISSKVAEAIRVFHPELKAKIRAAMQSLKTNACAGKELKNELEGHYSFRVGKFRVIYRLTDKAIEIIGVGPRKTIYQDTVRRIRLGGSVHERLMRYKRITGQGIAKGENGLLAGDDR